MEEGAAQRSGITLRRSSLAAGMSDAKNTVRSYSTSEPEAQISAAHRAQA